MQLLSAVARQTCVSMSRLCRTVISYDLLRGQLASGVMSQQFANDIRDTFAGVLPLSGALVFWRLSRSMAFCSVRGERHDNKVASIPE